MCIIYMEATYAHTIQHACHHFLAHISLSEALPSTHANFIKLCKRSCQGNGDDDENNNDYSLTVTTVYNSVKLAHNC